MKPEAFAGRSHLPSLFLNASFVMRLELGKSKPAALQMDYQAYWSDVQYLMNLYLPDKRGLLLTQAASAMDSEQALAGNAHVANADRVAMVRDGRLTWVMLHNESEKKVGGHYVPILPEACPLESSDRSFVTIKGQELFTNEKFLESLAEGSCGFSGGALIAAVYLEAVSPQFRAVFAPVREGLGLPELPEGCGGMINETSAFSSLVHEN